MKLIDPVTSCVAPNPVVVVPVVVSVVPVVPVVPVVVSVVPQSQAVVVAVVVVLINDFKPLTCFTLEHIVAFLTMTE